MAFLAWSLVAFIDCSMYLIAANSEFDLVIANILRDFALAFSNITCFALLFAVLVIYRGKSEATSKKMIALIISAFLVIFIFTDIFDSLAVVNTYDGTVIPAATLPPAPSVTFKVTAQINAYSAIGFIASLSIFFISIGILAQLLRKIKDPAQRRHIRLFLVGLVLIFVGYLWFFVIVAAKFQILVAYWIGYTIWTLAPVFALLGVTTPEEKSDPVDK